MNRLNLVLCWYLTLLAGLLPLGGCATYEFDLVKPEQFASHIGRQPPVNVALGPLEYRFVAYDDRLILWARNPTEEMVQLLGNQSAAVDAKHESHPLRSMAIPPGTSIKLVLPPMHPTVYDSGPVFGIGFGVSSRRAIGDPFWGAAAYDEPRYYTVYDDSDNLYWDWPGQTTARLLLTFQRGEKTFRDEFSFYKKKT